MRGVPAMEAGGMRRVELGGRSDSTSRRKDAMMAHYVYLFLLSYSIAIVYFHPAKPIGEARPV